jgi:hypothetical protein
MSEEDRTLDPAARAEIMQALANRKPMIEAASPQVANNFCTGCGKKLSAEFNFCPGCGTNIKTNVPVVNREDDIPITTEKKSQSSMSLLEQVIDNKSNAEEVVEVDPELRKRVMGGGVNTNILSALLK